MSENLDIPVDPKAQAKADKAYAKATRPWFKKKRFILLGVIVAIVAFTSMSGGGDSSNGSSANSTSESNSEETVTQQPPIKVSAQQLIDDLEANALAAKQKYEGNRVTVTGKLGTIDASGDYFGLDGNDDFNLTNVQIFISDDQTGIVSGYKKGQQVTVTGKVTGVGEILGYSIDAESLSN